MWMTKSLFRFCQFEDPSLINPSLEGWFILTSDGYYNPSSSATIVVDEKNVIAGNEIDNNTYTIENQLSSDTYIKVYIQQTVVNDVNPSTTEYSIPNGDTITFIHQYNEETGQYYLLDDQPCIWCSGNYTDLDYVPSGLSSGGSLRNFYYEIFDMDHDYIDNTTDPLLEFKYTASTKHIEVNPLSNSVGDLSITLSYYIIETREYTFQPETTETKTVNDFNAEHNGYTTVASEGTITYESDTQKISWDFTKPQDWVNLDRIEFGYTYTPDYYALNELYIHASPRSRKWYEFDENLGYFRSTDAVIDPYKTYYDGTEASVAYITNQELYIPRSVVTDKQALGLPESGQWMWEVSDEQNLSLSWVGKQGESDA